MPATPAIPLWTPPSGPDADQLPAGEWWDVLEVPAYLGDRMLARLGDASGAVIRDSWAHVLMWLISPGAAASWAPRAGCGRVLGAGCRVFVPPAARTRSAGLHWARPVAPGCLLTDVELLRAAHAVAVSAGVVPA